MLGRKSFTQEEVDNARKSVSKQLAAYRKLVKAVDRKNGDGALVEFETAFVNNLVLALDRASSTASVPSAARTAAP